MCLLLCTTFLKSKFGDARLIQTSDVSFIGQCVARLGIVAAHSAIEKRYNPKKKIELDVKGAKHGTRRIFG
jgi:hypothetical protein